jgi:hypothetical protein
MRTPDHHPCPAALSVLLVCLGACSGQPVSLDGGRLDAGSSTDAGTDAGFDGGFQSAPHRGLPQMPVSANPKFLNPMTLVTIVASNDADIDSLFQFSDALSAGAWWTAVAGDYGIGAPSQSIHLTGAAITGDMTNSELVPYIQQTVGTTGPQPNGNTLYLMYMPAGTVVSDATFCGYHQAYPDYADSIGDAWAVMTRCPPFGGGQTALQAVTMVASHEVVEAATDPLFNAVTFGPAPAAPWSSPVVASFGAGFAYRSLIEVGDLCEGTRIFVPSSDAGWQYQRIWSNEAAAAGGDPCVPAQAEPYFNVNVPQDWYAVPAGVSQTIPLNGWSASPHDAWLIKTYLDNGSAFFQAQDGGFWELSSDLGPTQLWPGCLERTGMNNGVGGTLTVDMPAGASSGDWAVFGILSFDEEPNCYPSPELDDYHRWLVGVYVP